MPVIAAVSAAIPAAVDRWRGMAGSSLCVYMHELADAFSMTEGRSPLPSGFPGGFGDAHVNVGDRTPLRADKHSNVNVGDRKRLRAHKHSSKWWPAASSLSTQVTVT